LPLCPNKKLNRLRNQPFFLDSKRGGHRANRCPKIGETGVGAPAPRAETPERKPPWELAQGRKPPLCLRNCWRLHVDNSERKTCREIQYRELHPQELGHGLSVLPAGKATSGAILKYLQ